MKNKSFEASKGFTLVELMVVIAIIGILAVVALGFVRGAQQRAKDSALQAAATNLTTALESYYTIAGSYPSAVSELWTGTEKVMDKAPGIPSGCEDKNGLTDRGGVYAGEATGIATSCGLSYAATDASGGNNEGYHIGVKYLLKKVNGQNTETITGGLATK